MRCRNLSNTKTRTSLRAAARQPCRTSCSASLKYWVKLRRSSTQALARLEASQNKLATSFHQFLLAFGLIIGLLLLTRGHSLW